MHYVYLILTQFLLFYNVPDNSFTSKLSSNLNAEIIIITGLWSVVMIEALLKGYSEGSSLLDIRVACFQLSPVTNLQPW